MDRFADRLAEKMMRDHEAQNFPDDEFSSDQGSVDDVSDSEALVHDAADIFGDGLVEKKNRKTEKKSKSSKHESNAFEFDEFVKSSKGSSKHVSRAVEAAADGSASSSDDGYAGLVAYEDDDEIGSDAADQFEEENDDDDDDDDHDDEEDVIENEKRTKRKKSSRDDDFANADEYEEQMDEIVRAYQKNLSEVAWEGAQSNSKNVSKKAASKSGKFPKRKSEEDDEIAQNPRTLSKKHKLKY
jgi:hypothetical protein